MNWQPIETAPRNIEILVAGPHGMTVALLEFGRFVEATSGHWEGQWTHWMPLPALPVTA